MEVFMELKEFREVYDSMVLPEKSDKKILNRIIQENFNGKKISSIRKFYI